MPIIFRNRPTSEPSPTLWVDAATGDDSRSKATVAASGGSLPWATIGRAAWGSTNRAAPNASEAAAAGDVVSVAAGTYTYTGTIDDNTQVVYNPANEGTVGNPITFMAVGQVRLAAPSANSAVAGAFERDYIKWYANVALGHAWLITCDSLGGVTPTTSSDSTHVNTRPDTGPVIGWNCTGTHIEGFTIDGGATADYTDNYDGITYRICANGVIRKNTITNFRVSNNGGNGKCLNIYNSPSVLIEYNDLSDAGAGIAFKHHVGYLPSVNTDAIVRNNRIACDRGIVFTQETVDARARIYRNLFLPPTGGPIGQAFGIFCTSNGLADHWIFNNTFAGYTDALIYIANAFATSSGCRFWGNVVSNCGLVIACNGITMLAATIFSFEHNVYHAFTNFYNGSDGNRTLASFNSAYTDQHFASPATVEDDPDFVDAAGGNYRVLAGSPADDRAVDIGDLDADGSTSDTVRAGCYLTGSEVIGVS